MKTLGRRLMLAAGLAGGLAAGQAPELAQQYRQRLGGALEELTAVVERFDADAGRSGLTRGEALERHTSSPDGFFRDRGASMAELIGRHDALAGQATRFDAQPDYLKPLAVLRSPDARVLNGAWRDYEPALPVTPAGLGWSLAGFALGAALVALLASAGGAARRRIAWRRARRHGESPAG